VCAGVAMWLGYRFASVQVGKVESGMDRVLDKIAHSLYTAGIQASDVRIYGAQRLITGRESGGSQEIDLGRMPYTIDDPQPAPDIEVIH